MADFPKLKKLVLLAFYEYYQQNGRLPRFRSTNSTKDYLEVAASRYPSLNPRRPDEHSHFGIQIIYKYSGELADFGLLDVGNKGRSYHLSEMGSRLAVRFRTVFSEELEYKLVKNISYDVRLRMVGNQQKTKMVQNYYNFDLNYSREGSY